MYRLKAALGNLLAKSEALLSMHVMGLRVGTMAGKFLIGLFVARFLGLEALGVYGLVAGAAVAVPAVARMGLLGAISRDVVTQSPRQVVDTLTHYLTAVGAFYALLALAFAGWGWMGSGLPLMVVFLVLLGEQLVNDLYVVLVNMKRALRANLMLFVQAGGWIFLYMPMAYLWPQLRTVDALLAFWAGGGAAGMLMGAAVMGYLPWREAKRPAWSWYAKNFHSAMWLWVSGVSNVGAAYVDRYIITLMFGLEKAGVYILFWQMGNAIINLVNSGIVQLSRPAMVKAFDTGDGRFGMLFRACCRKSMLTATGLAVAVGVAIPFVLPHLHQPLVDKYAPLLWVVLLVAVVRMASELASFGLFWMRRDRLYTLYSVVGVGSAALATVAGAWAGNLYGVAIANAVMYAGLALLKGKHLR